MIKRRDFHHADRQRGGNVAPRGASTTERPDAAEWRSALGLKSGFFTAD
jgi:hypothetical protein